MEKILTIRSENKTWTYEEYMLIEKFAEKLSKKLKIPLESIEMSNFIVKGAGFNKLVKQRD